MSYESKIPKFLAELAPAIDAALVKGAHLIADDAQQRLHPHRLTGELEREVHVDDRKRRGVWVLAGDPKDPFFAFYGTFLEFGTRHAPAYPFMIPAFESKRDEVTGLVDAAVRGIL